VPGEPGARLDLATIDDVRQALSPARYGEVLGGFLADWASALGELHGAVQRDQRADLGSRAHALKGAALSLGLRGLGLLAGQLQSKAPDAPAAELAALIDTLARHFDASAAECRERGLLPSSRPPVAQAPA
jgi:HPt (histidine-containing phosphotransfer) domain-containing protein